MLDTFDVGIRQLYFSTSEGVSGFLLLPFYISLHMRTSRHFLISLFISLDTSFGPSLVPSNFNYPRSRDQTSTQCLKISPKLPCYNCTVFQFLNFSFHKTIFLKSSRTAEDWMDLYILHSANSLPKLFIFYIFRVIRGKKPPLD